MADITMCRGTDCTVKEKCYRYTAPKGMRQSMFVDVPGKDEKCSHYWKVEPKSQHKRLDVQTKDTYFP